MSAPIPIDYTSKDYEGFRAAMIEAIPAFLPEWTSRSPSDFGIVLIELFAYMADILSFYGDRIANEAFLSTAVQRSSILDIAYMLDYRPTGPIPATTNLAFALNPGISSVTIPKGTRVQTVATPTQPAIVFETDAQLIIPGSSAATPIYSGTVSATQGKTTTGEVLGNSDGSLSQAFNLFNVPVIESTIEIYVDEGSGPVRWYFLENLIDANPNDINFTTKTDENGIVSIIVGDNVNGHLPTANSVVTANYRVGGGVSSNVGPGTLSLLSTPISGVISVTNPSAAIGGADPESNEHIRKHAPQTFATQRRAVTIDDYAALVLHVSGVALAKAAASVYTSITVYVAPLGGGSANATLKAAITQYLADKKMVNATVTLADPTYVGVNIAITINVLPQWDFSLTALGVQNAMTAMLMFESVDFGKRITLSQVYHTMMSVPGVDYGIVTMLVRADAATQAGAADIVTGAFEIPTLGVVTVATTGGLPS